MSKVEFLKEFAEKIGCVLISKGEVGFGRPCVGILEPNIEHYVDINPYAYGNSLDDEDDGYIFPENESLYPDSELTPHAYHKHSCLAVLALDGDYESAIIQLYDWVVGILSKGEVEFRKHSEVDMSSLDPIMQMFAVPYNIALVYEENK
jgi:hypothetical protein